MAQSERPWWLRLDGNPPSHERWRRRHWPDWDQIDRNEQARREIAWNRERQSDWIVDHHRFAVVLIAGKIICDVVLVVLALSDASDMPLRAAFYAFLAVTGFATSWWWVQRYRKARRRQ